MSAKNILWITERYPPLPGGMAQSCERQVESLRKAGWFIDVVVFLSTEKAKEMSVTYRDNGRDIFISHAGSSGNAAQKAWHEIQLYHQHQAYSLILGFGCNFPGHLATSFACWLAIPSVVLVRGNDFDRDWFLPRAHSLVFQALSRADMIGAVTLEKVKKITSLFANKRCLWTPNGIDPMAWQILPTEQKETEMIRQELKQGQRRIIGLFGELKYKKRIAFWLEAIRDANLLKQIALLIVGHIDGQTDALIRDPVLAPMSKHFSFREHEKLPALYHACDFLVIPSLFEGFPNVLLEAMACGIIPICSSAGAMGDIIIHGKNGFLFEPENREQAGEATLQALNLDDRALQNMQQHVRNWVRQKFSLEQECQALQTVLNEAYAQRR